MRMHSQVAIKKMDKKLIKHKNRYKSCETELACLRAISDRFICGLHYAYQTKDDVRRLVRHAHV